MPEYTRIRNNVINFFYPFLTNGILIKFKLYIIFIYASKFLFFKSYNKKKKKVNK